MTIVSFRFLLFVIVVVLAYYIVPKKKRWTILLIGSYVFYFFNGKWLLTVLLATSLLTYSFGLIIQCENDRYQGYLSSHGDISRAEKKALKEKLKKKNRRIVFLEIVTVIGSLIFLKYGNFVGDNLNRLFSQMGNGWKIPYFNLLLPMGISFYSLQAVSYIVDIYRGKIKADRNPLKFMLFMSFFPQIIQGPIPRHNQLANQLYEGHSFDYRKLCFGAQLIVWGFIKKLVIAERLAIPVNYLFEHNAEYSGLIVFFSVVLYGFQVYSDFSGGMDIARGVAQMFGIELELNFRQPYHAISIEDYWRRWHITMGSWMKDYVFFPLSLSKAFTHLSRKSRKALGQFAGKRLPAFMAMFIVYFCVGIWHGADWKYIIYGLWNGIFIMTSLLLENAYAKTRTICRINEDTDSWRLFRRIRTFVIVSFGRFFTGSKDLDTAFSMFGRTFRNWRDITFITDGSLLRIGLNNANWILLGLLIMILFYVDYKHEQGFSFREVIAEQHLVFRWAIYIVAILVILIFGYYGPEYVASSFIYEQF